MRHQTTALLAALAVLVCAAPASADVLDDQLAQLRPSAEQWWASNGLTATRCDTIVFTHRPMPIGLWAETLEGSALVNPLWAGERWTVCHVRFSDALVNDPARRCAVVLHEWGHILGLGHSSDPTNIMYGSDVVVPPVCRPPVKGEGSLGAARGTVQHARWAALRASQRLTQAQRLVARSPDDPNTRR